MIKNLIRVNYSRQFDKQLRKAPLKIKIAFRDRLKLFFKNPFHPQLNNHLLTGKLANYHSINITGDWRAIYSQKEENNGNLTITFEVLGTHSQLYK